MIDWQRVVLNIRQKRSLATVSRDINVGYQHLSRISRGEVQEPKFEAGIRLLDLHYKLCREKHTPMNIFSD